MCIPQVNVYLTAMGTTHEYATGSKVFQILGALTEFR